VPECRHATCAGDAQIVLEFGAGDERRAYCGVHADALRSRDHLELAVVRDLRKPSTRD